MQALKPNAVVDSRFEIVELLGSGGMGAVYKARQIELDRLVALKFLLPHLVEDEQSRARMRIEAEALASLTHPSICLFYSYSVWHGRTPYIAMEYLNAPNLSELAVQDGGRLSWRRTLNIVQQICKATAHAHRQGIIHRDLKPSNIFVIQGDNADRVKVTDFGLAKIVDDDDELKQKLTRTGLTLGSPLYMSPEQARAQPVTGATDVYAVGCIMYECLFGRPPFDGHDAVEILYQHQHRQCPFPSEQQAGELPRGIVDVLKTALAKDPAERFQSMDDMAAAIEKISTDSQSLRDSKSLFNSGGQLGQRSINSKSKPKQLLIVLTSIALIAAAFVGATLFSNSEFMQVAPLDSELQKARSNNDLIAVVKIEIQQAALYRRFKQNDKEQEALTNLVRDLSAATKMQPYQKMPDEAKCQFLGSAFRALTKWQPATKPIADLLNLPDVYKAAQEDIFYGVLRTCLVPDRKRVLLGTTAARILAAGPNSPYREPMIELFETAAGKGEMARTDDRKWLAKQTELINDAARRGSEIELVNATATLYFFYCLHNQGAETEKALRAAVLAIGKMQKNHSAGGSDSLNRAAQLCNDALTSYYAASNDDETISHHRNAIANLLKIESGLHQPDLTAWRISLADALRAKGDLTEALNLYEHVMQEPYANQLGVPTDLKAYCQVSRGDVFLTQKRWQKAIDSYAAAQKSSRHPSVSDEEGTIAANQLHFAKAGLMGVQKYMAPLHAETDRFVKAEPPESKDACWKVYSRLMDQAFIYETLGYPDKALLALDQASKFGFYPDHRGWIWAGRAHIYARLNQEARCLAACQAAVGEWQTLVSNPRVRTMYFESEVAHARAQRKFGHLEHARDILLVADTRAQQKLPASEPVRSVIVRELASVCAEQGATTQAIEYLNRQLDFDKRFGPREAEDIDRGTIAYINRDYVTADHHFRRALHLLGNWHAGEYPATLTKLAKVQLAAGNTAHARRLLKTALIYWEVHNRRNTVDCLHPDYLFARSGSGQKS